MSESIPPDPLLMPVLLVEDDDDQVVLMMRALRDLPVAPVHVESLGQALARVQQTDFAVVLLDLHLPDAVGVDGVEQMAQHHDTIIVLTGSGDRHEQAAIQAGADDYLAKEAEPREVRRAVRCALERRFRRQQMRAEVERLRAKEESSGGA